MQTLLLLLLLPTRFSQRTRPSCGFARATMRRHAVKVAVLAGTARMRPAGRVGSRAATMARTGEEEEEEAVAGWIRLVVVGAVTTAVAAATTGEFEYYVLKIIGKLS